MSTHGFPNPANLFYSKGIQMMLKIFLKAFITF